MTNKLYSLHLSESSTSESLKLDVSQESEENPILVIYSRWYAYIGRSSATIYHILKHEVTDLQTMAHARRSRVLEARRKTSLEDGLLTLTRLSRV